MKYVFFILALSGILLQNAGKLIIIVNFKINQEHIAKTICVKKEDKDNHCKGSCHLKKQLEESEKPASVPAQPNLKDLKETLLFTQDLHTAVQTALLIKDRLNIPYKPKTTSKSLFAVFHPPQA